MIATENIELLDLAARWRGERKRVAAATVVSTWGSAPRPPGGRLVVCEDGRFAGSVSGGCIENEVIAAAYETMQNGKPQLLDFGVADETAWRVGLSCGGKIQIHIAALGGDSRAAILREWKEAIRARAPCAFLTRLADDAFALVYPPQSGRENRFDCASDAPPDSEMIARAANSAIAGEPEKTVGGDGEYFIEPHPPTRRLVVVGATHIAQALIPFARATGFAPLVIDPRAAWATPERFAPTPVVCEWPQDALAREPVDSGCALVALTHDPKIDDPALASALRQSPRYIGALGGAQSNRKRAERLTAAGFSQAEIERIRAPVGIDIGAKTAAEIALSIAAQIVAAFRGKA